MYIIIMARAFIYVCVLVYFVSIMVSKISFSSFFEVHSAQVMLFFFSASFGTESSSKEARELLVQHLLVKDDDQELLLELQKRAAEG